MSAENKTQAVGKFFQSPSFKFIIIGVLSLALMIPLLIIGVMVSERQNYADKASRDVGNMWASSQMLAGPFLQIPIDVTVKSRHATEERRYIYILPETLNIDGQIESKFLKRGIFNVPVYHGDLKISGKFKPLDFDNINKRANKVHWDDTSLVYVITDTKGISEKVELKLDSRQIDFKPGVMPGGNSLIKGIHISLNESQTKQGFPFAFNLKVKGSNLLNFAPVGGDTKVQLKSNWAHPSFAGNFLPIKRKVSQKGFEASWSIPRLARAIGQVQSAKSINDFLYLNKFALRNAVISQYSRYALNHVSGFGVRFFQPTNFYTLIKRALKYAIGFIAISFMAFFILEIKAKRAIHWIQYVFVGLALIVFYMVLLALSEHIGFTPAYGLATAATAGLVGFYAKSAFQSNVQGLIITVILLLIYGLLYMLLRVEDYAMLIGALFCFGLLALVMYITRNVDWTKTSQSNEATRL